MNGCSYVLFRALSSFRFRPVSRSERRTSVKFARRSGIVNVCAKLEREGGTDESTYFVGNTITQYTVEHELEDLREWRILKERWVPV